MIRIPVNANRYPGHGIVQPNRGQQVVQNGKAGQANGRSSASLPKTGEEGLVFPMLFFLSTASALLLIRRKWN